MSDQIGAPQKKRFGLRDVPGTTFALTSLAVLGAAAVITTPVWLWYRYKKKRTDALLRQATSGAGKAEQAAPSPAAGIAEPAAGDATAPTQGS